MAALHHLSIDIETFSSADIKQSGLFRYAQSPDFEILLIGYSLDGGPVQVIDCVGGSTFERGIPLWFSSALKDPAYIKHAYNAAFEWYCLCLFFRWDPMKEGLTFLSQWRCTMLHGLYCGYPAGLNAVGKALGLEEDRQKLSVGRALIGYFSVPCAPTRRNGGRRRNLPHHDPEKWALFKTYNAQDVVTEMAVEERLSRFPVPEAVQRQWETDVKINLRGVAVDMELVSGAQALDAEARNRALEEAKQLTGLSNPNSTAQLLQWLTGEGQDVGDLKKSTVAELVSRGPDSPKVARMLELRQELSRTSTKKFDAFDACVCADGRIRGLLQFYGANRTGRWAGRLVQPQNLPRTYIAPELLPLARGLVRQRQGEALRFVFGSVTDTLSQLIRTAFTATPGGTLIDVDFASVEARCVAWLAGEEWALEVFRTHGKIYEATASQLYNVPMERIRKGREEYRLRQYGKAATLALGYGGGASALITAGHLPRDTPEEELLDIRNRWRTSNPNIVRLWHQTEAAAREAISTGRTITLPGNGLRFERCCDPLHAQDFLTITLPSGRALYYVRPHFGTNRFGQSAICHWGLNQSTKKWQVLETYGGKLVENITQAVARDCLAEAVERLEAAGYEIVFHIHDEVVVDAKPGQRIEDVERIMAQAPDWAEGLPLGADGWVNPFFKKD